MHHETTQLARTPLLLLNYAVLQGMDRHSLMESAGISADDLADPDSRIKTSSMLKLWRAVIDDQNDPSLGLHVCHSIRTNQLGLVGYAMYYSRDLRDALNRFARYGRILSEALQFKVVEADQQSTLIWRAHPSLVALRHPIECVVSVVVSIAREITDTDLAPINIDLPAPKHDGLAAYRAEFRCPIVFDRPAASVTFSQQQMDLPVKACDEALAGYLDDLATIKMKPLEERDESMVATVRRVLWPILPGGRPDLWRTAAEMEISARTLQRRLGEEGSSFSKVLDDLRRDLSDELLADRKLAVSEVAFLLGYSEPSAFQRAFRRWRGISPRRFRTA